MRKIAIGRITGLSLEGMTLQAGDTELILGWSSPLLGRAMMERLDVDRSVYVEFNELHTVHCLQLIGRGGVIFERAA